MQIRPVVFAGVALAFAVLGGCDDHDTAKQADKTEKPIAAAQTSPTRLGVGWQAVAETRQSNWGFSHKIVLPQGRMLAAQSTAPETLAGGIRVDALASIRTALMANMLPARSSVRIEALVNRAIPALSPPGPDAALSRPMAVLATTPWNDDTMLLWVEVRGLTGDDTAISVEFNPSAVAAFRSLGDPSALPSPTAAGGMAGQAAMLYELLLRSGEISGKAGASTTGYAQYAVLHIAPGSADSRATRLDRPITAADSVGTIDNAPEIVRFATAAAGFGGLLRGDPAMRDLSCNDVIALAQSVRQPDTDGWRAQLIALMYRAQPLIDLPPHDDPGK